MSRTQRLKAIWSKLTETDLSALMLVLCVTSVVALYNLTAFAMPEWDEALNAGVALEMLRTGDLLNYHFAGIEETIVFKPPLFYWVTALSFKVFGLNHFALRFPSVIFVVLTFLIIFKIANAYRGREFAVLVCLMLITCEALIGVHVGRTGDPDALFAFLLMAAAWHFLQFVDFEKPGSLYLIALFFGAALCTKGMAALIVLPGWFLYLIYRKKLKWVLQNWNTYVALLIAVLPIALWSLAILFYGNDFTNEYNEGENALESAFFFDIVHRFFDEDFDERKSSKLSFLIVYLDTKYSVWNYLTYALIILAFFKKKWHAVIGEGKAKDLMLFSIFAWLPLAIFLSLAMDRFGWYMAPVTAFIAFNMLGLMKGFDIRSKYLNWLLVLLMLFMFGRKLVLQSEPKQYPTELLTHKDEFAKYKEIRYLGRIPMNHLTFIQFENLELNWGGAFEEIPPYKNENVLLLLARDKFEEKDGAIGEWQILGENSDWLMLH